MKWTFTWRRDCFWRVDDSVGVLYFCNMSSSDSWAPNCRLLFSWNQLRNTTSVIDSTLYSLEHVFSNCVNVWKANYCKVPKLGMKTKGFYEEIFFGSIVLFWFSSDYAACLNRKPMMMKWRDLWWCGSFTVCRSTYSCPEINSTILRQHTHWFQSRSTFELLNALIDDHWLNSFHYMWHVPFYTSFL